MSQSKDDIELPSLTSKSNSTVNSTSNSSEGGKLFRAPTNTTASAGVILIPRKKGTIELCWDSFKRKQETEPRIDPESQLEIQQEGSNGIGPRHVYAIAIGGGLGTGLFVALGGAITVGGPVGLIVAFLLISSMLFPTMRGAGELAVAYSAVAGGFNAYASKLVDPSLGFAVSWNYAINWFTVLPLEMVTASMTIKYWNTDLNSDIFVAIFLPFVVILNLIGASGYAEFEFVANICKALMMIGFVILGLLIDTGVAGNLGHVGLSNFTDHPAFANGFKGVCATLVVAAFSLGGTEAIALTAADQRNPRKAIPSAVKQVFYRLVFFYFLSIFVVCLLVSSDSPDLMGSGQNNGAPVSPFVLAVETAGIKVVPHIFNSVILFAVISVGNSASYASSRTFYSLAQQGYAPKWFDYVDTQNRPLRAILLSVIFGLFSFIAAYENQEAIFKWLLSLSGLAIIFTWSTICISHIRFRSALKAQGISTDTLGYHAGSIFFSWYALILNLLVLAAQFWISLFPFNNGGKADVVSFFQGFMGIFSFLILYIGHKIYLRFWDRTNLVFPFIKAENIDLNTDRKIFTAEDLQLENDELKEGLKNGPFYKKVLEFLF